MTYPVDKGYKMPPEWNRHSRTLITWPICTDTWPETLEQVQEAYAAVARAIVPFEPVTLIVRPEDAEAASLLCGPEVDLLPMDYNDSWIRDNGPTFVVNEQGDVAAVNWQFNAWGGKFPWEKDAKVAAEILRHFNVKNFPADFVMEGGSIHVDGEGTLLTTEECLLNPNRNPDLGREAIAQRLEKYLDIEKIIWLKRGQYGDHTDGHVDNVVCFARPGMVILQVCNDPSDPNYAISQENLAILQGAVDARGRSLEIVTIEQPPALYHEGERMAASYINFYFVNGGIILPVFGGECAAADQAAQATLEKVFPDRQVVPVDGRIILTGGGNIHCLTQQMP